MHWLTGTLAHLVSGLLAVLAYVLLTRAFGERRPPGSAIAWVLGLALLPYVALPLYLAFGRRKARRPLRPQPVASLPPPAPWAARLGCALGLPPPRPGAAVFDRDGAQALDSALALIAGARDRLDVATFILGGRGDGVAAAFVDAMATAAARGVRVRLLLDGLASRHADLRALAARGIEARFFRPLFVRRDGTPFNLRDHRKLIVADGARLWSGGRNLAREYFEDAPGAPAWLDLSFRADGEAAADVARLFERDWQDRPGQAPAPGPAWPQAADGGLQLLPSGPELADDCAHAVLVDACFRAESAISAVTPYFVPDDALAQAFRLAAVRGVAVDIVLPAASNHRLADIARARAMRELAAAGVRFHLLPRMVHAKAVVVDAALAICGSTNLDTRSLLLNHELSMMFFGDDEIAWLAAWLRARIAEAHSYTPDAPGLGRDLLEGMVRSVAFQL